jgi:hypothetical protein
MSGGANSLSLVHAQASYREFGWSDSRSNTRVRPLTDDEIIEAGWRPIEKERDRLESEVLSAEVEWPVDLTTLYWWRPTYWRRVQ